MNKPELVINIADIYYNYDEEKDSLGEKTGSRLASLVGPDHPAIRNWNVDAALPENEPFPEDEKRLMEIVNGRIGVFDGRTRLNVVETSREPIAFFFRKDADFVHDGKNLVLRPLHQLQIRLLEKSGWRVRCLKISDFRSSSLVCSGLRFHFSACNES